MLYAVLFLSFFLQPLAETPLNQTQTPELIKEMMIEISGYYSWLTPVFHISAIAVVLALLKYRDRAGRLFAAYFAAVFVFIAITNNVANTPSYGLAVLTGNLIPMTIVAIVWVREALVGQSPLRFTRVSPWRYWVVPPAVLAFWFPVGSDLGPSFSPLLFLTSDFGVFYCPTTPVALAILTLAYPHLNRSLLTLTSFVGLIIGFFNGLSVFVMPGYTTWMFILHLPLIAISIFGLTIRWLVRPGAWG